MGDTLTRVRHALISVATGEVKWIDPGIKTTDKDGKEVARPLRLSNPVWSEEGNRLVLTGDSDDNKERWIFAIDPPAATARTLFHERDEAWINSYGPRATGFLGDHETVYFLSERDG